MMRERIKTVGFGLLGCGRGEEGMPMPRRVYPGKEDGIVRTGDEGYFELCVKSVEAVVWDPLAEEVPEHTKGFDRAMFETDADLEGRRGEPSARGL
jgi:hypothetical protein